MTKIRITRLFIGLSLAFSSAFVIQAQGPQATAPASDELTSEQKQEKEAAERKATDLLEQIVGQVSSLKLPDNRIRVEIAAANLLWRHNEGRARSLFSLAAEGVAEMNRSSDVNTQRRAAQLRQEVVLTVAAHDATLAYQLLATTRPLTTENSTDPRRSGMDSNLEERLLARVASTDPKLAAQKIEEELAKGQYPNSLSQVLVQLKAQDKEAAAKLSAKVVSKLQSENMLANQQAQSLALNLLSGGPMPASAANSSATNQTTNNPAPWSRSPVLVESSFQDLMNTVIDAALKATLPPTTAPGSSSNAGARNAGRGRRNFGAQNNQAGLTDSQIAQQNAIRLLARMQMLLPQIDKHLPARAAAVRTKMTELGMGGDRISQMGNLMRDGTTESLLAAAPEAPLPLQTRLYQQAALKALEEGNLDRARQIANDHLEGASRDGVLQKVDFQMIAKKVEADNMDELRQTLGTLKSDDERIDLLLQLAAQAQWATGSVKPAIAAPADSRLALQFLTEAQRLTTRRATNYQQMDQHLRVAAALAELDPSRSFEVLDAGISQINELLAAAALLNGFEVSIFRDGEMPLDDGSGLGSMVTRYGQVLATLAKKDFARAESSANKFQMSEARLKSQLAIVRNVLGVPQAVPTFDGFGGGRGPGRRRQF